MTKAGASERALKAAEEVRSLAMDYFGYATATGDTNEVYQKFPVTGVAAIIDAEFPAGDRRKGERREGSSSGTDKDYCLADGSYRRKSERRKNTTEQDGQAIGTPGEVPPPPPTPAEIAREIVDPFHHDNFSSTGDRVVREITAAIPLQSERERQADHAEDARYYQRCNTDQAFRIVELERQLADLLQYVTNCANILPGSGILAVKIKRVMDDLDKHQQEVAELKLQNAQNVGIIRNLTEQSRGRWRVHPDEDGEAGETWAAAFADCDMQRMELERQLAEQLTANDLINEQYDAALDVVIEQQNRAKVVEAQLSPSPCGVKGHCKVDWTERRAGERRGNAVPGIEDRRKYGSGGSWLERRITNSGGYCVRCGEAEEAKLEAIRHVATGCGLACRPRTNLDDLVTAIKHETGRAVTEALEECCMVLCTHCHCLCCGPEPGNAEVKPAVLIEGGWWHPVIWLPSGGADRVRCGAAAIRGSVQSLREWYACRITDSGGYCRRCKEINRACAEAELSEAERQGERIEKAVTDALDAAVVRFEFVALEYCERWKVMPKQFIDKGTAAIRGKAVKG